MSRLVIVSNRLPVTVRPGAEREVEPSSGGLVSALAGLAYSGDYAGLVWIGWPGAFVASDAEEKRLTALLQEENSMNIAMVPVWLTKGDVEDFYNGFSNSSLWPLLHWMTPYARFKKAWAESYKRVNELFAETVLSHVTVDDVIWVQDFHLFLVPQLLRRKHEGVLTREVSSSSPPVERPKDLPDEDFVSPHDHEKAVANRPPDLPLEDRVHCMLEVLDSMGSKEEDRFMSLDVDVFPRNRTVPQETLGTSQDGAQVHFSRISGEWRPQQKSKGIQDEKLKIGFFLHVPFPAYEVMCSLPQSAEIIEGMLGADLVGFHTYSYLRHFRSCMVRLCGFAPEIDHVEHRGQHTRLGVFPIGANCTSLAKAQSSQRFLEHLGDYTTQFQGRSLVLSVERLDYSKGMPQKLAAIERYLEIVREREVERTKSTAKSEEEKPKREDVEEEDAAEEPSREDASSGIEGRLGDLLKRFERRKAARGSDGRWRFGASLKRLAQAAGRAWWQAEETLNHAQTVFLFVAVPSRQEVDQYKAIELEVHRRISDINGRFSTPSYQPIVYIHRSVPLEELTALYARADCCMVTPLVDGMNLVAKEFLVAKDRNIKQVVPGTVVLSELAGAAQELFDAIVVNPYDEDAVAEAIALGLELTRGGYADEELRWEVTETMRKACLENDSLAWAQAFLGELQDGLCSSDERTGDTPQPQAHRESTSPMLKDSVASLFFESNPGVKALFLDYDGTLRELERNAQDAVPSEEARQLFHALAKREDLRVFIISGRSKEFMEEHFGDCRPFTLIAEYGYYERGPGTCHEWQMFNPYTCTEWISKVEKIMDLFTRCTPGSRIEVKDSAILWHYEQCDEEYGQFKAKDLMHQLSMSLGNLPCQICHGPGLVEVCSLRIKKGLIVANICQERERAGIPFAEVLCIGDDESDESMFMQAPATAWTVKVGSGESQARHRLRGPADVRRFLRIVADLVLPKTPGNTPKGACFEAGDTEWMRYRSCVEDPRDMGSTEPRRTVSDAEGDPLAGLPEVESFEASGL